METSILDHIFKEGDFTADECSIIKSKFKQVAYEKGDLLLKEGEVSQHYWFVESGFFRAYLLNPDGDDVSTNFFHRGEVMIDWSSFFMRQPTRENIEALTPALTWQLDFNTFQELFHSIEAFREAGRSRLVSSYFELKRHSVSLISDLAKDRYLRLLREKPEVIQNVSLKQIASYLGVTDTSLSRIRKEIAQEKT